MSTPNFSTMDHFPLYVLDTNEEVMEWYEVEEIYRELDKGLSDVNYDLLFHEIEVKSGYYTGLQFYVEELADPNDMTNEDCRYEYDLCRSVAIRRYQSEINKICRILRKLAAENGFEEYYCAGVFGNGEAIYYRVQNTVRSRIHRAAKEVPVRLANDPLLMHIGA